MAQIAYLSNVLFVVVIAIFMRKELKIIQTCINFGFGQYFGGLCYLVEGLAGGEIFSPMFLA
ncbi:hypothetical protein GASC598P17_001010, partial [Gilliamella apis SCGC AB-598-P17]